MLCVGISVRSDWMLENSKVQNAYVSDNVRSDCTGSAYGYAERMYSCIGDYTPPSHSILYHSSHLPSLPFPLFGITDPSQF
jgi:hypothetical protein